MKLLGKKAIVLLLCIPLFPFVMFAEWYDAKTSFGRFNFRKESKFYWKDDVWSSLKYRKK